MEDTIENKSNSSSYFNRFFKALSVILLICLIVSIFYNIKINVDIDNYKKAVSLKSAHNYEEAKNIFLKLGNFIDSNTQLDDCNTVINKYEEAVVLIKYKDFQKAKSLLEELHDFKNTKELLEICNMNNKDFAYDKALNYKESGNYSEAIKIFEQLADFKDSSEQFRFCSEIITINNSNVGDIIKFGKYEQDADEKNGKEAIEWTVLDKENNKVFLLSKYGLDTKSYEDNKQENQEICWEKCSLRHWLNNDFYNLAFNDDEKSRVLITNVSQDVTKDISLEKLEMTNLLNLYSNVKQGSNTSDRVFLLGINEVYYYSLGICEPTEFVKHKEDYSEESKKNNYWLLRTVADKYHNAIVNGKIHYNSRNYSSDNGEYKSVFWPLSKNEENYHNKKIDSDRPFNSLYSPDNGEYKCLVRPAIWVNLDNIIIESNK